jgi:hypothetical protein
LPDSGRLRRILISSRVWRKSERPNEMTCKSIQLQRSETSEHTTENEQVMDKNKDNRNEKIKKETYKYNKKEERDKNPKEKRYA